MANKAYRGAHCLRLREGGVVGRQDRAVEDDDCKVPTTTRERTRDSKDCREGVAAKNVEMSVKKLGQIAECTAEKDVVNAPPRPKGVTAVEEDTSISVVDEIEARVTGGAGAYRATNSFAPQATGGIGERKSLPETDTEEVVNKPSDELEVSVYKLKKENMSLRSELDAEKAEHVKDVVEKIQLH